MGMGIHGRKGGEGILFGNSNDFADPLKISLFKLKNGCAFIVLHSRQSNTNTLHLHAGTTTK